MMTTEQRSTLLLWITAVMMTVKQSSKFLLRTRRIKTKGRKQTQNQKHSWLLTEDVSDRQEEVNNEDCGAEFDTSLVDNQNGDPVLCQVCRDSVKEELKKITSATGAARFREKTQSDKENHCCEVQKEKSKINRPGTPVQKTSFSAHRRHRTQSSTSSMSVLHTHPLAR